MAMQAIRQSRTQLNKLIYREKREEQEEKNERE